MARGEDKTVAIEPFRLRRVVAEVAAEEHRADLRGPEGQAQVARAALVDGIDGEAAGFGGGLGKGGVVQVAHVSGWKVWGSVLGGATLGAFAAHRKRTMARLRSK